MPNVAAIYARKSTEQSGVSDEDRSVARQVDHARRYAASKGWTVDEGSIFADDGISGAEFVKRPGFVRLMAALRPRPAFDVLIMSEESRLGREMIETSFALKQIIESNVRVFLYLDDRELTLSGPLDRILLSVTAFAKDLEREKASQRTHDAFSRKVQAGHVTGGRVFGYDNVEVLGPPDESGRQVRQRVERRINDVEASVVRRIFALCAEGVGKSRIAKTLNAEGARAPRSQRGRPRAWAPSSVHEVLNRPLYRGEIVWNRTRKRNQWGRVAPTDRPEAVWLRQAAEHLRLVPEDLWRAAHARLAASRASYLAANAGRAWGRPRDVDSKYMLSGLARCGVCGGGLIVRSRSHGKRRAFLYACGSYHQRGPSVCTNRAQIPLEAVDRVVLDELGALMTPDVLSDAVEAALAMTAGAPGPEATVARASEELSVVEAEIERLTSAIAAGGALGALVAALKARTARAEALRAEIRGAEGQQPLPPVGALRAELAARAAQWREVLAGQVGEVRQLLRKILAGPVVVTPERREAEGWAIRGAAALDRLISAENGLPRNLASPTGFEPVF